MTDGKDAVAAAAAVAVEKWSDGGDGENGMRCQPCCGGRGYWACAHAVQVLVSVIPMPVSVIPKPVSVILILACVIPELGSVIPMLGSMIQMIVGETSAPQHGGRS